MPLHLADILAQPITSGGWSATSGATSLANATTAGNTLLVVAATYGTTGISAPSGYTLDTGTNVATQKVYIFRKSNIAASETLPTLSTGASTQKTVWFALELTGLELVGPKDVAAAISTTGSGSVQATATATGTYYDTIGLALHLAEDPNSTTPPTWSGQSGGFVPAAAQGQADASTAVGAALSAVSPLQALALPVCSATSSATGPLAAVAVKYVAAGAKAAADLRHFTGFEFGTTAGIATGPSGSRLFESASGSPTVTTSTPRSGSYCLELPNTAVAHNLTWPAVSVAQSSGQTIPARVCFRFVANLPTSDTEICSFDLTGPGTTIMVRYRTATQQIGVQVGTNTEQLQAGAVSADTWHVVEVNWDGAMTTGTSTCAWRLDDVEQSAATAVQAGTTGVTMRIGRTQAAAPGCVIRYDDCLIAGRRGNYPLGDHKVVLLTVDPAGTLSVNGSTANFNTFTANGTMAAWNATTARDAIDEVPPTIGASADGLAQVAAATADYVIIPMATYTAAADETLRGVRMLACGWAAGTQAKTLRIDAAAGQVLFALADPLFDNSTTPAWVAKLVPAPSAGWTQTDLDGLTFRVGLSDDATPDVGIHAIYAEVAVAVAPSQTLFGTLASAAADPLSGGILGVTVTNPAGAASVLHTEYPSVTDTAVAAGATQTVIVDAPDAPTTGYVALYPDPEPDPIPGG